MRLNLGAGSDIQPDYTNHDILQLPGIEAVHDLDQFPWPWDDESVSRIRAYDVFEHVWQPLPFVRECYRVLKPGGQVDLRTVHWQSPNYHRDPDHKRGLDEHSFDYWVAGTFLHAKYGPAYTGGCAVFEYIKPVELLPDGNLSVLLRKPQAAKQ